MTVAGGLGDLGQGGAVFTSLMQQLFLRSGDSGGAVETDATSTGLCRRDLSAVVEHVVDELDGRLRMAPGYARVLGEPVATTLRHIDDVAESVPGPLLCSRSVFTQDPYVNAFFVSPQHVQEVFSHSEDVREVFEANPLSGDCWGLLCMHMREQTRPGIALKDDQVRRDVMQTSISFADHQVVSPGSDESSARCALKCCMFDGLLAHIRRESIAAKTRSQELQSRLQALRARQRRASSGVDIAGEGKAVDVQIEELEQQLSTEKPKLSTLSDHLGFVADTLSRPAEFLSTERYAVRLNRQAVKLGPESAEDGSDLELSEIRIASHEPRIGVLVRFPRDELLPKPDMLKRADLFLAI